MRKSGVSEVLDEDATRMLARGIWRTTRHTDKRAALHRSRPPADQPGKRVASKLNGEVARHARRYRIASSRECRACRTCRRGFYEDATRKLLSCDLSLIAYKSPVFTGRISLSICRSVCHLVTNVCCGKTADSIEILFGIISGVG